MVKEKLMGRPQLAGFDDMSAATHLGCRIHRCVFAPVLASHELEVAEWKRSVWLLRNGDARERAWGSRSCRTGEFRT